MLNTVYTTQQAFNATLGGALQHPYEKEAIDAFIKKHKQFTLSAGVLKTYNKRFGSKTLDVSTVEEDVDVTNEKPFDVQLARAYLNKHKNAVSRGIEFTLTLADMRKLLKKKTCYYTGQKLTFNNGDQNRLSLDRVDNKLGYTKENTVACCHWVNQWKNAVLENTGSDAYISLENLLMIVAKLK